jgi:hypothetical protein
MFVMLNVLRGTNELEARVLAPAAGRERLAVHASHFVLLRVRGVMRHFVDAGALNRVARLKLIADRGHVAYLSSLPLMVVAKAHRLPPMRLPTLTSRAPVYAGCAARGPSSRIAR